MTNLLGRKVKVLHIHSGVDLIGSKTSMAASRNVTLTVTEQGIMMDSKSTNRTVVIPYGNIKGYELFPAELLSEQASDDQPAKRGRPPKTV